MPGSAYQLRAVWSTTALRCRVDDPDGQHATMHSGDPTGTNVTLQLLVGEMGFHLEYLAFYDMSGETP